MDKIQIKISERHDIVGAKIILENGDEHPLTQGKTANGDPTESLLLEKFYWGDFKIQLRIDFGDKEYKKDPENRNPPLDADVYDKNGKKYKVLFKKWHHTQKTFVETSWVYEWDFQDLKLPPFRLGTVNQRQIPGVARIISPGTES